MAKRKKAQKKPHIETTGGFGFDMDSEEFYDGTGIKVGDLVKVDDSFEIAHIEGLPRWVPNPNGPGEIKQTPIEEVKRYKVGERVRGKIGRVTKIMPASHSVKRDAFNDPVDLDWDAGKLMYTIDFGNKVTGILSSDHVTKTGRF